MENTRGGAFLGLEAFLGWRFCAETMVHNSREIHGGTAVRVVVGGGWCDDCSRVG